MRGRRAARRRSRAPEVAGCLGDASGGSGGGAGRAGPGAAGTDDGAASGRGRDVWPGNGLAGGRKRRGARREGPDRPSARLLGALGTRPRTPHRHASFLLGLKFKYTLIAQELIINALA